ncbi:o-succinylbenzoate synthase [Schaalia sp. ZJ1691]|uniref:o-succinylbenzoate synthase n=1 Tax=Schaalia sp. ZJ1691 TaxID=2709404 RepID=UPI0013EAD1C3|nr:o-succinylbenzoate synthase [Schaalia sp. ZJ1691]
MTMSPLSRNLRVTELPINTLPPTVRAFLDGIERVCVYSVDMTTRFRRVTSRDGLFLLGEAGWGEAAPFWDYDAAESSLWLRSAYIQATRPPVAVVRSSVAVNVTIPVVGNEDAQRRVCESGGCETAKVKVADPGVSLAEDASRVEAVADALARSTGGRGRIRVDANGAWNRDDAIDAIRVLDRAASAVGGLEYVEQPCATVEDLASVRRRVDVPIAADESIRRAHDPLAVARAEAADIAVVKVAPLGGVERALNIGADTGLDVVISSALETSIGLSAGVRAAAALPGGERACGLATAQLLQGDACEPLLPRNGRIEVRAGTLDERFISDEPVDERLVERWHRRLRDMVDALSCPFPGAERTQ